MVATTTRSGDSGDVKASNTAFFYMRVITAGVHINKAVLDVVLYSPGFI